MDGNGELIVVPSLNSFCAFKKLVGGAGSDAGSSPGSPKSDKARVARMKAIDVIVGDLVAMKTFQIVAVVGRDVASAALEAHDAALSDVCLSVGLSADGEVAET